MIIRTPRRRISPRTKLKYRAIKNFFRKTLGTSLQGNNTYSSIEVSVSDLKTKIEGIEQELNKVNKHCQDISCLKNNLGIESDDIILRDSANVGAKNHTRSERKLKDLETKILYKNRQSHKTDESNDAINISMHDNTNNMISRDLKQKLHRVPTKKNKYGKSHERNECAHNQRKHIIKSKFDAVDSTFTSSCHSLVEPKNKQYIQPSFSEYQRRKPHRNEEIRSASPKLFRNMQTPDQGLSNKDVMYDRRHKNNERSKREYSELDQDFIAKIIKKQYKPVKIFGARNSDFSQFSAPVCRDQEFKIREDIEEGSELCSCFLSGGRRHKHQYVCYNDLSDMRSICDTRLYSSKRHRRHNIYREYKGDYNNSNFYDIIPVKEKSSPKSRRKFAEENRVIYQYLKEVPPSPRSNRPRLNLKAQHYSEFEEDPSRRYRHHSRKTSPIRQNYRDPYDTDFLSESSTHKREHATSTTIYPNITQLHQNNDTVTNLQSPKFINDQTNISNNNTTLNTQVTDRSVDKTDKTLGEIKEILQNFLLEIKKESTHSDKSNITSKLGEKSFNNPIESDKINTTAIPNSGHNFNMRHCNVSPFLQSFANPCCYPILPMYPMNCLQNGYILPSPSLTCTACAKNSQPNACVNQENTNNEKENHTENVGNEINTNNETQELIKEIYKFVSQNPKSPRKLDNNNRSDPDHLRGVHRRINKELLTNRSVGGSSKASKHDANVGTLNMRSFSKSCEAIRSRNNSDTHHSTNASYSDTVLERLSLEATESSTESNTSSDVPDKKRRRNKFQKLLKSLRLFKKKRKDTIEEVSESESTMEADVKPKPKPPFRQSIACYGMHGQEYPHPVYGPAHCCPPNCQHDYSHNHDDTQPPLPTEMYHHHRHVPTHGTPYDPRMPANYNPMPHSPFTNYDPYNQIPPQVPLCLREIEVKSIATQSERKMSIFRKFNTKGQPNVQTNQQVTTPPVKKSTFWDTLQEKVKRPSLDPMDFSLKTQKQLAQGDMKLRNAMLKKLFYKRNPFSPRNLIVRTLLGKDKSSFGDPPKMYKPRMFM